MCARTSGAVGVGYGVIRKSPLYAVKGWLQAAAGGGHAPTRELVFVVVSLILWALVLIVTLKYVTLLLSADNND